MDASDKSTSLWGRLKRYLIAGIALTLPLFITIYLILVFFRFTDRFAGKFINNYLFYNYGFRIPGLGVLFLLLVLLGVGFLSSHFIGRKIFPVVERYFLKIPFVANIYPSAKQLSDFLFGAADGRDKFQKVALVQYPFRGSYSIGFVTNESLEELNRVAGERLISVLIPLAPAPFSGIIVMLPPDRIKVLEMSFDQAIKFIVSGGVVSPVAVKRGEYEHTDDDKHL